MADQLSYVTNKGPKVYNKTDHVDYDVILKRQNDKVKLCPVKKPRCWAAFSVSHQESLCDKRQQTSRIEFHFPNIFVSILLCVHEKQQQHYRSHLQNTERLWHHSNLLSHSSTTCKPTFSDFTLCSLWWLPVLTIASSFRSHKYSSWLRKPESYAHDQFNK